MEDHPGSSDGDDMEVPAGEGVAKNNHVMRERVRRRGYVSILNTPHHSHQYRLLPRVTAAVDEDVLAASEHTSHT